MLLDNSMIPERSHSIKRRNNSVYTFGLNSSVYYNIRVSYHCRPLYTLSKSKHCYMHDTERCVNTYSDALTSDNVCRIILISDKFLWAPPTQPQPRFYQRSCSPSC